MKNQYYNGDICIVGIGCVLPGADNPSDFWKNILGGKCIIKEMPEERFNSGLYLSKDRKEEDKAYSNKAAFVENNNLKKICDNSGSEFSKNNRLQIMASEATRQALSCLRPDSLKKSQKNTSLFLGCMEMEESFVLEKIFRQREESFSGYVEKGKLKDGKRILSAIKKYFNKGEKLNERAQVASVLTTSVLDAIKKKFVLGGEGVLIDAACASSMAALDAAIGALRGYKANLAITGGMEGNLGVDTFVLFSKVGAMSAGICHPFDKSADGLSQGEGAVIFILQRMEDALADKNKIYGVIKSAGGSSDGRSSSLFSPSLGGQMLAYKRAYDGIDKESVDYIECHGTGTKIGDDMEIRSLNNFFEKRKIPIGSVKSLIGHTKGAAGAAGLLKCVLMLEKGVIPPSRYIKSPLAPKNGTVYLNTEPVNILRKDRPLRFGVSSFGFGNINYHLVLDEYRDSDKSIEPEKKTVPQEKISIIGSGFANPVKIDVKSLAVRFKIPLQSIASIDRVQLLALVSVADAFEKANIDVNSLDKEKVSVIAASSLGLDFALDFVERIRYFELKDALNFADKKTLDYMMAYKNRLPAVTEDTGHGVLNNVIAGRICNVFDFKGKNFNVDSDFSSFPAALNIAIREIGRSGNIVILVFCDEKLNGVKTRVERKNISCLILAPLSLAKRNNYPIIKLIRGADYDE